MLINCAFYYNDKSNMSGIAIVLHKSNQWVNAMVFNATCNNISVISWRSVLLVEETGVPGENSRPAQVIDENYHVMLYRVHLAIGRDSNSQR